MKTIRKQDYITAKKAAELLGKHERWLQNDRYEANKGKKLKIPFIKQDKRVLYKREDILKFKERLDLVTSAGLIPSNPLFNSSDLEYKIHAMTRQTDAKVEDLAQRVRSLEEKKNKGWFARLFS